MGQPFGDLVERYAAAIREGRRDDIKAMLAEEVSSFDAMPPLESTGKPTVAGRLDAWMDSYDGPMGCEVRFGGSAAEGEVGFCWFLERITGTSRKGTAIDMWVRVTWCLRRSGEAWLIVHEHQSDPFEPETLQARIDLLPEA